jgi:hypothetical protein
MLSELQLVLPKENIKQNVAIELNPCNRIKSIKKMSIKNLSSRLKWDSFTYFIGRILPAALSFFLYLSSLNYWEKKLMVNTL